MNIDSNERNDGVVVHVFGRTDVGLTRDHNEDAFIVADLSTGEASLDSGVWTQAVSAKGMLFMVADGMGGAAAGEVASAMAVEVVLGELRTGWMAGGATTSEVFVRELRHAASAANGQINTYASHNAECRGMGTTATIAGIFGDTLYLAQVGDSRAYLVRNGAARQITKDQSLIQKLVEAGEITEEEAEQSARRNIILQALGPEPTVAIDLTHQTVRRHDVLVLCSDGLSGQVTRDEIAAIVEREPDLAGACDALIDCANAAGGPDNITVIVARFEGAGLKPAVAEDEVGHQVFALPDEEDDSVPGSGSQANPRAFADPPPAAGPRSAAMDSGPGAPPRETSEPTFVRPEVSTARHNVGTVIAIALLVLLLVAAAWFVGRSVLPASRSTATTSSIAPQS